MKKRASALTAEECLERLHAAAEALVAEGVSPETVTAALLAVTLKSIKKSRRAVEGLDAAAKVFSDYAERTFQQEKQERAEKRAMRLGLTDN